MGRPPKTVQDAANLLKISELLTNSVRTIVNEVRDAMTKENHFLLTNVTF